MRIRLSGPWHHVKQKDIDVNSTLQRPRCPNCSGLNPLKRLSPTLRVHVPNNWVLGTWAIVIRVQLWGKYMMIKYLDP